MRNSGFGFFKLFFGFVALVIVGLILFRVNVVMDARSKGKTIYEIRVNTYNQVETYVTSEYTRDKESGCITFKDEFGIKKVVCNNYTISEY